jgi:hypothetical protein
MNGLLDWQDVALVYPFSAQPPVLDGSRLVWSGRSRFDLNYTFSEPIARHG